MRKRQAGQQLVREDADMPKAERKSQRRTLRCSSGSSTSCPNARETVEHTFSTGRKSFSTSIDLGLSFIGLSLKISPKPTPLTFFGWIAAVATVPLAPSDLVLLESPPSLSEPVVSLKPVKRGDGERKSSEISHSHAAPHSQEPPLIVLLETNIK